jgi:hypothetical protein
MIPLKTGRPKQTWQDCATKDEPAAGLKRRIGCLA